MGKSVMVLAATERKKRKRVMEKLKVSFKLFWPHATILLLLVVGIIVSSISFINIGKQGEALYNESFAVRSSAETVNATLEAMQMSVFRIIANDSQDVVDEATTDAKNDIETIQEQVALLRQTALGDMDTLSRMEKDVSELAQMQEYVLALAAQSKTSEAVEYMENNNIPAIKEVQAELAQFIQAAEEKEHQIMTSLQQTQKNAMILLISLGVASVLFSMGAGTYFWRLHKEETKNMINPMQVTR